MTSSPRPRVVYLAGAGRSGTTILSRVLGSAPGVVSAGEVVHLWQRGIVEDERCACGRPFRGCPHWRAVGDLAFGGWDTPAAARMHELRHRIDRQRHLPRILLPGLGPRRAADELGEYVRGLTTLYRAVATVGDGDTVVDTSKHGSTAHVLRHATGIDLQVLLLLRHPSAVSNSWRKRMERPESTSGESFMPTYDPASSAAEWLSRTLEGHAVAAFGVPVHVVRYEELMADPARTIPSLCERLGIPGRPPIEGRTIDLGPDHTVAGHPNRLRTGPHVLQADERWHRDLSDADRRRVALVAGPVARAYGYRFGARNES